MKRPVVRCIPAAVFCAVVSFFSFFFFSFFFTQPASAQWTFLGPYGGDVFTLAVDGETIIAGTFGTGVYASTDAGAHWKKASTNEFSSEVIYSVQVINGKWYAATESGILTSTDKGTTWNIKQSASGVFAIYPTAGKIYIGTSKGVYTSTDEGASWQASNAGMTTVSVSSIIKSGQAFLAGTPEGFYRSIDGGASWEAQITLIPDPNIRCFEVSGAYVFAGTPAGVVRSSDDGASWETVNNDPMSDATNVYDLLTLSGDRLIASTPNGFLQTVDGGNTWTKAGLSEEYGYTMMQMGSTLVAGTNVGASISLDNGATWRSANTGITGIGTTSISILKNSKGADVLYAGGDTRLYSSSDHGDSWTSITRGASFGLVNEITSSGNDLYVASAGGPGGGVFRSTDDGASWELKMEGLVTDKLWNISAVGSDLYVGTWQVGLFHSSDRGDKWQLVPEGPVGVSVTGTLSVGNTLFASSYSGIYRSTDKGLTWVIITDGLGTTNVFDMTYDGSRLYAATYGGGVYVSTDKGESWETYDNILSTTQTAAITFADNKVFVASGAGIYFSTDQGQTWVDGSFGLGVSSYKFMVAADATTMYMATSGGIWRRPLSEFGTASVATSKQQEHLLSLSPNPVQQSVTVSNIPTDATTITVLNVAGQEVMHVRHTASTLHSLDVSALPAGCYVVQVASASAPVTSQFIKQ